MAYLDQYNLAMDAGFQSRVLIALLNSGRKFMIAPAVPEPDPVEGELPSVAAAREIRIKRRGARLGYVRTLLNDTDRLVRPIALLAVTVPAVTDTVTDAQLQTVVDTLLEVFAGAQEL